MVTKERIEAFKEYLKSRQVNSVTIEKYASDIERLGEYLDGRDVTQESLENFKLWLLEEKKYQKSSVNSYIISARSFCKAMNWKDITITAYSIDNSGRDKADKYISRTDYEKLLEAAINRENYRIAMLIQTLCHMDIRYSELEKLTVESLKEGFVKLIRRKSRLKLEIPEYLRKSLAAYARYINVGSGIVFRTSNGKIFNRSNAWKEIKQLCETAGLDENRITLQKLKMPMVHDYYPFYPMLG